MFNPFTILFSAIGLPFILLAVILKGVALWQAATHKQSNWFIALLLINTLGILEVVYLLFFSKSKNDHYSVWLKNKFSSKRSSKHDDKNVHDIEPERK